MLGSGKDNSSVMFLTCNVTYCLTSFSWQMAPLGYGILSRVQNLDESLRHALEERDELQDKLKKREEELQVKTEALQLKEDELERKQAELVVAVVDRNSAQRYVALQQTQTRIMEQKLAEYLVERRNIVADFDERLQVVGMSAIEEYKSSEAYAQDLTQACSDSFVEGFEACRD